MALLPTGSRVCTGCGAEIDDFTVIWQEGAWWDYCLRCVAGALLRRLASAKNVSVDGMDPETKEKVRRESIEKEVALWH